jgi:serine/threonine-protein kinase ATR
MPFWRSISVGVVKQLLSKPQVAAVLTDFVSMDVKEFLRVTQSYTLPYLVLWKNNDIISRIAQAVSKKGVTVQVLCHENMAFILALLFVQDTKNVEATAKGLLASACDEYHKIDLGELVRPDAIPIAAELLKLSADADPALKKRVCSSYRECGATEANTIFR